MKYRISRLYFPIVNDDVLIKYVIEYKRHWWNKWRFMMYGNIPQLYSKEQIEKIFNKKYNETDRTDN